MADDHIKKTLEALGLRRRRAVEEMAAVRAAIHEEAVRASTKGWNNQRIAVELGVTREIIRRHVGPTKTGHGEQERS